MCSGYEKISCEKIKPVIDKKALQTYNKAYKLDEVLLYDTPYKTF